MGLIYKITNLINNHAYIGLTTRKAEIRWEEHKRGLTASYESQYHCFLHEALRKYGLEAFQFEVIEDNISDDQLNEREIYWISYYDTYNHGYNMTTGGKRVMPKLDYNQILNLWNSGLSSFEIAQQVHSRADYIKIILNKFDIDSSIRNYQEKRVPVLQYDLQGNFIAMHPSIAAAASAVSGSTSNITKACMQNICQAYGYIWLYTNEKDQISLRVESVQKRMHGRTQAVNQYDLNDNFIQTFPTITSATQALGLKSNSSITNVLKGRSKSAGGYKWKIAN